MYAILQNMYKLCPYYSEHSSIFLELFIGYVYGYKVLTVSHLFLICNGIHSHLLTYI